MNMMVLAVASGGAVGSLARYFSGVLFTSIMGPAYPYGTLFVNIVGSFLIGIITEYLNIKFPLANELRALLVTGFLGGFTTFSSFSLDVVKLIDKQNYIQAFGYVMASVAISLIAVFAAVSLMRGVMLQWQN